MPGDSVHYCNIHSLQSHSVVYRLSAILPAYSKDVRNILYLSLVIPSSATDKAVLAIFKLPIDRYYNIQIAWHFNRLIITNYNKTLWHNYWSKI